MNLWLINPQQIMATLKLLTPMLNPPSTSVATVPAPITLLSFSANLDNNPKGENTGMVGTSEKLNQQVTAHFSSQDQQERVEYELLKYASLKYFEDQFFLKRLRLIKGYVGWEM